MEWSSFMLITLYKGGIMEPNFYLRFVFEVVVCSRRDLKRKKKHIKCRILGGGGDHICGSLLFLFLYVAEVTCYISFSGLRHKPRRPLVEEGKRKYF